MRPRSAGQRVWTVNTRMTRPAGAFVRVRLRMRAARATTPGAPQGVARRGEPPRPRTVRPCFPPAPASRAACPRPPPSGCTTCGHARASGGTVVRKGRTGQVGVCVRAAPRCSLPLSHPSSGGVRKLGRACGSACSREGAFAPLHPLTLPQLFNSLCSRLCGTPRAVPALSQDGFPDGGNGEVSRQTFQLVAPRSVHAHARSRACQTQRLRKHRTNHAARRHAARFACLPRGPVSEPCRTLLRGGEERPAASAERCAVRGAMG